MEKDLSAREQAVLFQKKGVLGLRDILTKTNSMLITDLDDTVKEAKKHLWADGKERKLFPETVIAMLAIHNSGAKLGIATEQAFSQIEPFISDISQLVIGSKDPYELFNGLIVGEGGSVVNSKERGQVILAPKRAIEDREKIVNWLWENVIPSKMGPHISEKPEYIDRYKFIEATIRQALTSLGIKSLTTFEAGNGTLRIVPKYVNKAHSLELLSAYGVLELTNTVYSCDGPNDIKLAEKLKTKGGGVIAVANAVPKLHEISDYSATLPAGKGFAEAIFQIFPLEYLEAQKVLKKYKLV